MVAMHTLYSNPIVTTHSLIGQLPHVNLWTHVKVHLEAYLFNLYGSNRITENSTSNGIYFILFPSWNFWS